MDPGGRFFIGNVYICSLDPIGCRYHIILLIEMELHNIVFSPTETSLKIARSVADGISGTAAAGSILHNLTLGLQPGSISLRRSDLAVIAAPVYGGRMAPMAKERMKHIVADSTPCVLIAVYGNRAFENALSDMAEFVSGLGFVPVAAGAFVGEHSYSRPDTPIAVGRPDRADLDEAFGFGKAVGETLKCESLRPVDVAVLHDEPLPEESLANFRAFVKVYSEGQKVNPVRLVPLIDPMLCSGCGKCFSVCPADAVSDDCRSSDPAKCIKCCACVKGCPSGARSLSSPFAPVLSANFSRRKSPQWTVG